MSRRAAIASRIDVTAAGSEPGPCRKRQFDPSTSSREYPLSVRNAALAKTIGLSCWRGSVMIIGIRVARTAAANGSPWPCSA